MLSYFRIQQQHKLFLLLSEVQVVRKVYHQPNWRLSYLQNQCNSVLKKLSNASNKNIDQPSTNQNRDYFSLILRNCPKQICEVPPKWKLTFANWQYRSVFQVITRIEKLFLSVRLVVADVKKINHLNQNTTHGHRVLNPFASWFPSFTRISGAAKSFMKTLKAFIKTFWGTKNKNLSFYFNTTFLSEMREAGKVNMQALR